MDTRSHGGQSSYTRPMAGDGDDDLRTMLRDFRTSVAAQFDEHGRRLDRLEGRMDGLEGRIGGLEGRVTELTDEFRDRTRTMEAAILNAIRDLSRDVDRRLSALERSS